MEHRPISSRWTVAIAASALLCAGPRAFPQAVPLVPAAMQDRTIDVDGNLGDWVGIRPAFQQGAGDRLPPKPIQPIATVFLCQDESSVFMRIDLADYKPPAVPELYVTYEVAIQLADYDSFLIQFTGAFDREWNAVLAHWKSGAYTALASGSVARTPIGLEGRFPLPVVSSWIRWDREYPCTAQVAYQRPGREWATDSLGGSAAPAAPAPRAAAAPSGDAGNGLFGAGGWVEILGYGLLTGGAAVSSASSMYYAALPVGLVLIRIGSLGMTAGGLLQNLGLDQRQAAYRASGRPVPDGLPGFSWALSWISAGCQAASFLVPLAMQDATSQYVWGWVLLGIGTLFECWGNFGPRAEWAKAVQAGLPGTKAASMDPLPVLAVLPGGPAGAPAVLLGAVLRW